MDSLEEIKKRLDLVEYINKHVPLAKVGRNFKAPCPFHSEKTASFIVSPERQIWHCFGACGEGGDIFKFLMKWENITFGEAIRTLAKQAGVELKFNEVADKTWDRKQKLFAINQLAADFYQFLFSKHKLGAKARDYIEQRKVNTKIAEHFYLGYSPNSWNSLTKFLNKKGYVNEQILAAGLSIRSDNNRYYDRFRSRLMFPLTDNQGNILGFSGRLLSSDKQDLPAKSAGLPAKSAGAKYINSPETLIYHKRENLYGLYQAKKTINQNDEIILVEGEFDAILAHQYGYTNTVAIKGSALTQDHLRKIKRLTSKIVFALDMDPAGNEAVKRGVEEAEKFDFQMNVLQIQSGKDPADVFSTEPGLFKTYYENKTTIYEFLIDNALLNSDINTIYGKKAVIESILPYLDNMTNPILLDYYLKMLSEKTDVPLETVKKSLQGYKYKQKQKKQKQALTVKEPKQKREEKLEDYLIALLVQSKEQAYLFKFTNKELNKADYYSISTFYLLEKAANLFEQKSEQFLAKLAKILPKELIDIYNKGFLLELASTKINWKKEIEKTVLAIKKYSLKKQIKEMIRQNNKDGLTEKTRELKEVEKTLSIL